MGYQRRTAVAARTKTWARPPGTGLQQAATLIRMTCVPGATAMKKVYETIREFAPVGEM